MTSHHIAATVRSYIICALAAIALTAVIAYTQHRDAADDQAACARVSSQARMAAQPDTWGKLDREGRRLTNYDQIGKSSAAKNANRELAW